MPALLGIFGPIGLPELVILGVIVLLLFGNRLPSVMRSLGRGVIEFKKGVSGDDEDDDKGDHSKDDRNKDDRNKDDRNKDDRSKSEHKS